MSKSTSLKKLKTVRRSGTIKTKDCLEEKVEKINLDDFDFYQKLSKVNNGVLRLCQKIENGHYFCMRVLKKVEILERNLKFPEEQAHGEESGCRNRPAVCDRPEEYSATTLEGAEGFPESIPATGRE